MTGCSHLPRSSNWQDTWLWTREWLRFESSSGCVSKEIKYEQRKVPRSEYVSVRIETITCDKCGKDLDRESDDEDKFPNQLRITLNEDECVNDRVRLDLCTDCLRPIWEKICQAIGADPETGELRIGQDDDWPV